MLGWGKGGFLESPSCLGLGRTTGLVLRSSVLLPVRSPLFGFGEGFCHPRAPVECCLVVAVVVVCGLALVGGAVGVAPLRQCRPATPAGAPAAARW